VVPAADGPTLDPGELLGWTEGRIAGFKRPRRLVVTTELPLNASGKVDKTLVRALAAERLG
jgi:acyl-CoA synthetase (AMP-forming)/AMP-acid ligase II